MDSSRFDRLARSIAASISRRRLIRLLVLTFLSLGGLAGVIQDEDGSASRRRRRKARRRRRQRARQRRRENERQRCTPACAVCQVCDTTNGQCGPDPDQLGNACGGLNEVCRVDGSCDTCDVCLSGCTYSSMQEAIDAANNGDIIHICAGDFSGTITIDKSVILIGAGNGAGAGNTTLNGNENGTVVTINTGPTVTLQSLRIDSGDNINGGGVFNQGTLNLNGCTVTGCGADQGGGIYNTGSLILNQSSIEGNFATNNEGGGIYNGNGGDLEMNRSQISNNTAGNAGGGLFNDSATATLNNSTISGNTATGQNGNPGEGGGIYNQIGTITLNSGSSVTNNNPDNCAGETVVGCSD